MVNNCKNTYIYKITATYVCKNNFVNKCNLSLIKLNVILLIIC